MQFIYCIHAHFPEPKEGNSHPTSTSEGKEKKRPEAGTTISCFLCQTVLNEYTAYSTTMSEAPRSLSDPSSSNVPTLPLPRSHRKAYRMSGKPRLCISVCQQPSAHHVFPKKVPHMRAGRHTPEENMKTYRQSHEE